MLMKQTSYPILRCAMFGHKCHDTSGNDRVGIINMMYERSYIHWNAIQARDKTLLWAEYKSLRNKFTHKINKRKNSTINLKMRFNIMLSTEIACGKLYRVVPNKKHTSNVPQDLSLQEFKYFVVKLIEVQAEFVNKMHVLSLPLNLVV